MGRATTRELQVGAVMIVTFLAIVGLLILAGSGPGYLTSRRSIDVVFRDAQGLRVGCPVRVAGLDAGRVAAVDLTEIDGVLHAKVTITIPKDLAERLRQDAKITIVAGITGQAHVNVVSSGRSTVALVPGQVVKGVETSLFDPIMEQVGLGPVERGNLSHTIAEVRQTVDAAGPRLRQILASLQATAADFRDTAETVRPAVESIARRLDEELPKVDESLQKVDRLLTQMDGFVSENRPNVKSTLANISTLTASANEIVAGDRKKVEDLLDGVNGTRIRADRMLYQGEILVGQANDLLAKNRATLDRTFLNVRDATDYGDKLVQKLYANPFVLSPFYKPTPEDVRAQATYDTAHTFLKGAKELSDSTKTLQAMQTRAMTPNEKQLFDQLIRRAGSLTGQLESTSRQLAEGLRNETPVRRRNR